MPLRGLKQTLTAVESMCLCHSERNCKLIFHRKCKETFALCEKTLGLKFASENTKTPRLALFEQNSLKLDYLDIRTEDIQYVA